MGFPAQPSACHWLAHTNGTNGSVLRLSFVCVKAMFRKLCYLFFLLRGVSLCRTDIFSTDYYGEWRVVNTVLNGNYKCWQQNYIIYMTVFCWYSYIYIMSPKMVLKRLEYSGIMFTVVMWSWTINKWIVWCLWWINGLVMNVN